MVPGGVPTGTNGSPAPFPKPHFLLVSHPSVLSHKIGRPTTMRILEQLIRGPDFRVSGLNNGEVEFKNNSMLCTWTVH